MKPAELDALLIDRAAGELSPEAVILLAEHLAADPVAARRAAEFAVTWQAARQAVGTIPPAELPPLMLPPERPIMRLAWLTSTGWKLAACLAVGLLGGWLLHQPKAEPAALLSPAVGNQTRTAPPVSDFWSTRRWLAASQARVERPVFTPAAYKLSPAGLRPISLPEQNP